MATNKNSFLLYCNINEMVKKLPDEKAGQLFKLILAYVNDENPTTEDILLEIAFEPIKQSLKQDLKKWESIVERNKSNGSKGGRPKKEENPENPVGYLATQENPKKPKKAVFVFDNDIDNDNDILLKKESKENKLDLLIERQKEFYEELKPYVDKYGKDMVRAFYDYWSEQTKTGFKMRKETQKTWETPKRLGTWQRNDFKKKPSEQIGSKPTDSKIGTMRSLDYLANGN